MILGVDRVVFLSGLLCLSSAVLRWLMWAWKVKEVSLRSLGASELVDQGGLVSAQPPAG